MQIVRDKIGHVVRYLFDDGAAITLAETGLQAPGLVAADIRPATHEIIQAVAAPPVFVGGALTYNGTWVVIDEQAVADAVAAQQAAAAAAHAKIVADYTAAVQRRLDAWAAERNYDGILSLTTYASDPDPRFAVEGQRGVDNRSATWATCYAILAEVEQGLRPAPTIPELLAELPELTWPA